MYRSIKAYLYNMVDIQRYIYLKITKLFVIEHQLTI